MKYSGTGVLTKATFVKRYKRFFVDAVLEDGTEVTAHCPNTGSMKSCFEGEDIVWLSKSSDPNRKLAWTLELVQTPRGGFVGVNTSMPNKVIFEAVSLGKIPELSGYGKLKAEVKYGENSRIDLYLSEHSSGRDCYVEVKNTTLLSDKKILFPDAVTERGTKHVHELLSQVKKGSRGVFLFFVNRSEGDIFTVAADIDPTYAKALRSAVASGVEVLAYRADFSMNGLGIGSRVPVEI